MNAGSGIIFWLMGKNGPAILVGKESVYVSDLIVDSKTKKETEFGKKFGAKIKELESTNSTVKTEEDAKTYFRRGARELESILGIGEIRYDTPKKSGSDKWIVTYRYLPKGFKRGIIKGRREGSEDAKQTILREVAEELGFRIGSKEALEMIELGQCTGYTIFSLEIDNTIWRAIKEKIEDRKLKKSGEVFDLDFKELSYLKSPDIFKQLNDKTACSINLFTGYLTRLSSIKKTGGKRIHNKKRKTKNNKKLRKTKKTRKTRTSRK